MARESGGLSAAPFFLFPSCAVRAAPTLNQLRLLGFRVLIFFLGGGNGVGCTNQHYHSETVQDPRSSETAYSLEVRIKTANSDYRPG